MQRFRCERCGKPLRLAIARRTDRPSEPWPALGCAPCAYAQDPQGRLTFWAGGIIDTTHRKN